MLCIVQARMSSKRLPGKVLMKIQGKTLIERVVERVSESKYVTKIIVATSKHNTDIPLRKLCFNKKIECYASSLSNVADRFYEVLEKYGSKSFLRINADSPFIDPQLIDKCLFKFNNTDSDIVTNVFPRTFPKGQSVEIIKSSIFKKNLPKIKKKAHLEHITKFFYENNNNFKINTIRSNKNYSKFNMCVDTASDIKRTRIIYKKIPHLSNRKISWKKIIEKYYEKNINRQD
jgi:spore coat polysaccharide biosynthesis protein SpsF (cytidylyltransferase family)